MENTTHKRGLSRHILALFCSTGFLAVVPVALYGGLIVWSGDLGGALNLVIIPLTSAIIGFVISLVAFLPCSLLAERSSFRRSQRMVGRLLGVLTAVAVVGWIFVGTMKPQNHWLGLFLVVGSVCLYFGGGFFVYLCCLAVCRRV